MSILGSDGASLLVGDGAGTETFTALRGATVSALEISQQVATGNAVRSDAWSMSATSTQLRAMLDGDALATDEAPQKRLRALALSGASGNFRMTANGTETWSFTAYVTRYREVVRAGEVKRLVFRLETSGAVSVS